MNKQKKRFLFFLLIFLQLNQVHSEYSFEERYIIAALERRGWGHFQNLEVKDADLNAFWKVVSFPRVLASGLGQYDIKFELEGVEYSCYSTIHGRLVKQVKIQSCESTDGRGLTLPLLMRSINSNQMNEALENYQRRAGKSTEAETETNIGTPQTINE